MTRFASLETGCREYIDILNKPKNRMGDHIGPDGASRHTLMKLHEQFSPKEVTKELERQFNQHRARAAMALAS
ncbi:hypothetical protein HGG70_05170 [Rhodobacteraceae bacterium R_SAG4]|nr:hypothetical protein [Rhodobacteraceae bacterium R_SAG4]